MAATIIVHWIEKKAIHKQLKILFLIKTRQMPRFKLAEFWGKSG